MKTAGRNLPCASSNPLL